MAGGSQRERPAGHRVVRPGCGAPFDRLPPRLLGLRPLRLPGRRPCIRTENVLPSGRRVSRLDHEDGSLRVRGVPGRRPRAAQPSRARPRDRPCAALYRGGKAPGACGIAVPGGRRTGGHPPVPRPELRFYGALPPGGAGGADACQHRRVAEPLRDPAVRRPGDRAVRPDPDRRRGPPPLLGAEALLALTEPPALYEHGGPAGARTDRHLAARPRSPGTGAGLPGGALRRAGDRLLGPRGVRLHRRYPRPLLRGAPLPPGDRPP